MIGYYDRIKQGESRTGALRQVQLALLRGQLHRDPGVGHRSTVDSGETLSSRNYRHPYYWTAFILSGDWRNIVGGDKAEPCKKLIE